MDAKKIEEMMEAGAQMGTMMAEFYRSAVEGGVPEDAVERMVIGYLQELCRPKPPPMFTLNGTSDA